MLAGAASVERNSALYAAMQGAGTVFSVVVETAYRIFNVSGYIAGSLLVTDDDDASNFMSASGTQPAGLQQSCLDMSGFNLALARCSESS